MEARTEMEMVPIEPLPMRPKLHKKLRTHKHVNLAKSNPKVITRYNAPNPKL